jgi:hypothetical protein
MSCDGWGIGDKCKTKKILRLVEPNGRPHIFKIGAEGEITDIRNYLPHRHVLKVLWYGPNLELDVPEADFDKLAITRATDHEAGA